MIHYDHELGLSDLGATCQRTLKDLIPHAGEFDSIAVQGVSGMIVGAPVALALNKPLVVVRKDVDMIAPCWHVSMVENSSHAGRRTLFLDDYVGRGTALRDVEDKISQYTHATMASRYEYSSGTYLTGAEAHVAPLG